MLALTAACCMAALKFPVPASTEPQLRFSRKQFVSRRQFAASALGAMPALFVGAANADFKAPNVELSDERKAQLRSQGGPLLGGEDAAFRIQCDRDDQECLDKKRSKGVLSGFGGPMPTKEERREAIRKQAATCRTFCREDLKLRCEAGDTECLAKKEQLKAEAGVKPEALLPYIGAGAAFTVFKIATAPEKTSNPKGMQIREDFYGKRKKDTDEALSAGKKIVGGRVIDDPVNEAKVAAAKAAAKDAE